MLGHMTDNALNVGLKVFNRVWDTGQIPSDWKQAVIGPISQPKKDPSDPSSCRHIALTSQLGKTMEQMVTERLAYFLKVNFFGLHIRVGFIMAEIQWTMSYAWNQISVKQSLTTK